MDDGKNKKRAFLFIITTSERRFSMKDMFSVHVALCALSLLTGCYKPAPVQNGAQNQGQSQAQVQPPQPQTAPVGGLPTITRQQLPPEGQQTLSLIERGGPFPYPKDGVTFGNYEGRLPQQPRGYYHEYTVPTPGAKTRATRRIVCGTPQNNAGPECYYTGDHYATFSRIAP